MIIYFPEIYPDELVYSWFCRYYVHSGCVSHKIALKNLMYSKSDAPSKEFIGHLNNHAFNTISHIIPIEELVINHTMYPEYARFLPYDKKKYSLEKLINNKSCDPHQIMTILPRNDNEDKYLKFCSECVSEDRIRYGETYWHRSHQLRGVNTCVKHLCKLQQSHVTCTNDHTFVFYPAESNISNSNDLREYVNYKKTNYEKYLINIFSKPLSFYSANIKYGDIINYYIYKNGYTKGNTRCVQKLYDDMCSFYLSIGVSQISSFHQLQKVLYGKQYEFYTICQIAYFLNIKQNELLSPSKKVLSWILNSSTEKTKKKSFYDWKELDKESIKWFEEFVSDTYYGNNNKRGRPEYVSEKMVCKELKVSPSGLKKMPMCYSAYNRYKESYEENWARRIIWAYKKILYEHEREPCKIYSCDIRKLSGVKEINFFKTYKYWNKYINQDDINILKKILSI